ncbi:MAG: hypothetical protein M5U29_04705 [Anaerolineae bacterium]|nr:hypothetical protein [Anaerolineae bacterium]
MFHQPPARFETLAQPLDAQRRIAGEAGANLGQARDVSFGQGVDESAQRAWGGVLWRVAGDRAAGVRAAGLLLVAGLYGLLNATPPAASQRADPAALPARIARRAQAAASRRGSRSC